MVQFPTVASSFLVILAIFSLIFSRNDPTDTKAGKIIEFLNQNWKVLLLLGIPLFYYPIRTFIEEMYEFRGAKRQKKNPSPEVKLTKKRDGQQ